VEAAVRPAPADGDEDAFVLALRQLIAQRAQDGQTLPWRVKHRCTMLNDMIFEEDRRNPKFCGLQVRHKTC
jgi:hypothetical protein